MAGSLGKTEICNIALRRLGVRPINNIESDTGAAAIELRAAWDLAVESVLRISDWNFATKITALAVISDETVIGWDYLYMYPSDCVMAWKLETINSMKDASVTYKWEKLLSPVTNTPVIAADLDSAYLRYTARVTDPTAWDMDFINALGWRLAVDVCQRLTSDSSVFNKCVTMYTQFIAEAQTMNKVENNNDATPTGPYVEVR